MMRHLQVPPPPAGTPGPLARPTSEAIAALLEGGGFRNVAVEEIDVVFDYTSPEEFVTSSLELVPPLTALLAKQPQNVQDEARAAMIDAARKHAAGDGAMTLSNKALLASGEA